MFSGGEGSAARAQGSGGLWALRPLCALSVTVADRPVIPSPVRWIRLKHAQSTRPCSRRSSALPVVGIGCPPAIASKGEGTLRGSGLTTRPPRIRDPSRPRAASAIELEALPAAMTRRAPSGSASPGASARSSSRPAAAALNPARTMAARSCRRIESERVSGCVSGPTRLRARSQRRTS